METLNEHPSFVRAKNLPSGVGGLFPHNVEEAKRWEPAIFHRALSMRVLVVAVPRIECAWSAYIDAVPGINHTEEYQQVRESGTKLNEDLARLLFPIFDDVPYAD